MISRRKALALLCAPAFAARVRNWGWDRQGARFELEDGSGEIHWISESSFRLVRRWPDSSPGGRLPVRQLEFTAADAGDHVLLQTKFISVRIHKADFRLRVTAASDNRTLLDEIMPARKSTQGTHLHFAAAPGEEFFGLGPRTDIPLSARGITLQTEYPVLLSNAGYGMYHSGGACEFDFRNGHNVTARLADRVEYCFYYGPAPKEILEEHKLVRPMRASGLYRFDVREPGQLPREAVLLPQPGTPTWESLAATVRSAIHAALSGIQVPAFDVAPYLEAPAALRERALQLAAVMPVVLSPQAAPPALAAWRARLSPYFITYIQEADDRGLPMFHPLPLQFPTDKEAAKRSDAFLLGDELLVAPALSEVSRRSVYLPMGLWTDLATNAEHRGRRTVEVEATSGAPALLAKNGSIVPLARPDGVMELHYFPNLGAEFFLYEADSGETSQFHAGPAADYLRLEIESKVSRTYEWVVHHRGPARKLEGPATIRHDAEKNNLHVTLEGPSGTDRIVNILI